MKFENCKIMVLFKILCIMATLRMCGSKPSSRVLEGYSVGYLGDCAGTSKEARITPKSLRKLSLVLYSPNAFSRVGNMTEYNYYQMKALSKHLDFTKKTVVYVNGYLDSNHLSLTSWTMCSVYKRLGYNVLALEYLAFHAWVYPKAVRLLRPVGKHTAEMLAELTKYGLDPKKLEIIGLSHGGQTISFIGKNFNKITGRNISKITALDPSGPCFRRNGPEDRIDASDAEFVEVIHTNIDGYGLAVAAGHVDFYVNGGEYQQFDLDIFPCTNLCSHTRAYTLWIAALLHPNSFIGMQCDSIQDARDGNCFDRKPFVTNVMGPNVNKSRQGIFYLTTESGYPYAMGKRGLEKKLESTIVEGYNDDEVLEV